jgi:hypothetical protein
MFGLLNSDSIELLCVMMKLTHLSLDCELPLFSGKCIGDLCEGKSEPYCTGLITCPSGVWVGIEQHFLASVICGVRC